jgi:transposase InsO family protein
MASVPAASRRRDVGVRLPAAHRPALPAGVRVLRRGARLPPCGARRRHALPDRVVDGAAAARGDAGGARPRFLIHDRDATYGPEFDRLAAASGIEVIRTPVRAPRANAVCERFLGSVRRERVDHVLVLGERQLRRVLAEYVAHVNRARPHQGIGQRVPVPLAAGGRASPTHMNGEVIAVPVLGGLHHEYRRAA